MLEKIDMLDTTPLQLSVDLLGAYAPEQAIDLLNLRIEYERRKYASKEYCIGGVDFTGSIGGMKLTQNVCFLEDTIIEIKKRCFGIITTHFEI